MGRRLTGLKHRWGNQANATDPLLEAPGSLVAVGFLLAYLIVWWPFMAITLAIYVLTAAVTGLVVLLSLPCALCRRVRPRSCTRRPPPGPHTTPAA